MPFNENGKLTSTSMAEEGASCVAGTAQIGGQLRAEDPFTGKDEPSDVASIVPRNLLVRCQKRIRAAARAATHSP